MYCLSHRGIKDIGFTAMHDKDERGRPIPSTFNYDFWVCAECMKPTRMVFEKMTNGLAPKRATALLSAHGSGDGRWTLRWATEVSGETIETMTFNAYPRSTMLHDQGRNICLELWERLDIYIDEIRSQPPQVNEIVLKRIEDAKVKASELADIIALVMAPFYETSTAVLQESMVRWTARQNGSADGHQTPGLAEHHWQPVRVASSGPASVAPAMKVRKQFDDQKKNFILHSLNNGIMGAEQLAKMFECSVDDIKGVLDDA